MVELHQRAWQHFQVHHFQMQPLELLQARQYEPKVLCSISVLWLAASILSFWLHVLCHSTCQ